MSTSAFLRSQNFPTPATTSFLVRVPTPTRFAILDLDLSEPYVSPFGPLDLDLSEPFLPAPWLAGDELHRETYGLVSTGVSWRQACAKTGADYTLAQHCYRARGLPSPIRTKLTRDERTRASQTAYAAVLSGEPLHLAVKAAKVSPAYFRRFCRQAELPSPVDALKQAKADVAAQIRKFLV